MKWHVNDLDTSMALSISTSTSVQAQLVTSVWCRMTCSSWLVIHDVSLMRLDSWLLTCDLWLMTWLVTWLITHDLTHDLWLVTCDSWLDLWRLTTHDLTHDLIHDQWLVTHDVSLMQLVIFDSWLLTWLTTCDSWLITCDLTRDLWLMTSDLWSTCDSWHVTYELWPLIQDLRLATHDMTHDLWLMVHHLSNHDLWLIIWTLIITQFITALTARPTHQVVNSKIQFSLVWKFWIDKDSCEIWLGQVSSHTILGTNMLEHSWHTPDHLWCSDSCCN